MARGREYVIFEDRVDAGHRLAEKLRVYADQNDVVVIGIPRGGLVVAFEVALALHAPLGIFLSRKLGVPGHEELAFGAISSDGSRVLDREIIDEMGVSQRQVKQIIEQVKKELERRDHLYWGDRPALKIEGRTTILVDDGIATGSSIRAGIIALWQMKVARLVVAVPVAPEPICRRLRLEVDELVCLQSPKNFRAVDRFYRDFSQVTDEQVIELLRRAQKIIPVPPPASAGIDKVEEASVESFPASDAPGWIPSG